MPKTTAPYGSWASPIDAADTISKTISFVEIHTSGKGLLWVELRPGEQGRQVLVRRTDAGAVEDLTPPPANVRTRVHEYGGGAVLVDGDDVYYSEFSDQRLYRLGPGLEPNPVTPEADRPGSVRFADGCVFPDGGLVYVRETHPESGEAVNELVRVDTPSGEQTVLVAGSDFYSNPRVSSDRTTLAWLEWDHPNMPWDGTRLMVAPIGRHGLGEAALIAGGPSVSVFQPDWSPDGSLVFADDRSGWWNLWRWDGSDEEVLVEAENEFGLPQWTFGRTVFGFLAGDRILTTYYDQGRHQLGVIEPGRGLRRLDLGLSRYAGLTTDGGSKAWFAGFPANGPSAVMELDVDTGDITTVRSNPSLISEGFDSVPESITFPTGESGAAEAHAVYYPPANRDFEGSADELAPLMVRVHGGPTSQVDPIHTIQYAYWTSRGFGVVDVNYRGSTGYGRRYREALNGQWGVADVDDCAAAARYLAEQGRVDGKRLVIAGGSAGGFTTLAALAFGDVFSAGASLYGVADIGLLAEHTHKFESRYMDRLVGTDPRLMRERSPLYSADRISVPVILFQGLDDQVVPPEQSEAIAAALAERGVPHAYITYEGEDHGFRKAENIVHSLESELAFYGRVFGFEPADELPTLQLTS